MNILVVDDSPIARKMIIAALPDFVKEKAEIRQAKDGAEGVEKYKEQTPNLVFLDLTMPVMDGFETLEKLKEYDINCNVIIVTADIQTFSQERAMSLGAKMILTKPIRKEHLQDILEPFFQ